MLARDEFGALGEAFNQMAARVEETVDVLRKFASDAAHGLKTPLTALITDLELIFDDMRTAELDVSTLERAQSQAQRLNRLMDDLLDLSHLESGQQEDPTILVNLTGLLQEVAENFATQSEQHELDFELELPDTPLAVMGSPEQLRRAVANLLDNALKFSSPPGSIQLRLRALKTQAEICVTDTGIGLLAEDFDLVFNRFHRGRNASSFSGSGLGLAIVQAIVQAHGVK